MNEFFEIVAYIVGDSGLWKSLLPFPLIIAVVFACAAVFRQQGDRALFFGRTSLNATKIALIIVAGVAVAIGSVALVVGLFVAFTLAGVEFAVSDGVLLAILLVAVGYLRLIWYPAILKNIFDHLRRIGRLR